MTTEARLRAFVAVAETGSVRAAAQRLVVTESAVSAAVSALTRDVGAPLLERQGRGLRLTPRAHLCGVRAHDPRPARRGARGRAR